MLHRRAPLSFPATVGWLLVCLIALALAATIASAQTPAPAQKVQASPMPAVGMGFEEARHLLSRTSFGARPEDIETFARLSRVDAVDRLLAETRTRAQYPAPPWAAIYERPFRPGMTPEQRKEANRRELVERGLELRTWWVAEMLSTPTPLTEKMTLFWHNHFVSSQQKVRTAQLMYAQNALLRQYALGNFGALLRAVSKDPAMLSIWTAHKTARAPQTRTSRAKSWNCSRWAKGITPKPTSRKSRVHSPVGASTRIAASSVFVVRCTMMARR